jgi:hypothetical protein
LCSEPGAHTPRPSAPPHAAAVLILAALAAGCRTSAAPDIPYDLYELMSDSDVALAVETMQLGLETGSDGAVARWSNPETGNSGAIKPVRTYQTAGGYFCRDFEELLNVEGIVRIYEDNHACRADDGVWRFIDD